jgi:hypothetical protein
VSNGEMSDGETQGWGASRAVAQLFFPVVLGAASWWAVRAAAEIWFWICPLKSECRLPLVLQLGALYVAFVLVGASGRLISASLVATAVGQVVGFTLAWPSFGGLVRGHWARDVASMCAVAWEHLTTAPSRELVLAYLASLLATLLGWLMSQQVLLKSLRGRPTRG